MHPRLSPEVLGRLGGLSRVAAYSSNAPRLADLEPIAAAIIRAALAAERAATNQEAIATGGTL